MLNKVNISSDEELEETVYDRQALLSSSNERSKITIDDNGKTNTSACAFGSSLFFLKLIHLYCGLCLGMLALTLYDFEQRSNIRIDMIGILFTARAAGQMTGLVISHLPGSETRDKLSSTFVLCSPMLSCALATLTIAHFLLPWLRELWLLLPCFVLQGCGISMALHASTLVVKRLPWRNPLHYFSHKIFLHLSLVVGLLLSSFIVLFFINTSLPIHSTIRGLSSPTSFSSLSSTPIPHLIHNRPKRNVDDSLSNNQTLTNNESQIDFTNNNLTTHWIETMGEWNNGSSNNNNNNNNDSGIISNNITTLITTTAITTTTTRVPKPKFIPADNMPNSPDKSSELKNDLAKEKVNNQLKNQKNQENPPVIKTSSPSTTVATSTEATTIDMNNNNNMSIVTDFNDNNNGSNIISGLQLETNTSSTNDQTTTPSTTTKEPTTITTTSTTTTTTTSTTTTTETQPTTITTTDSTTLSSTDSSISSIHQTTINNSSSFSPPPLDLVTSLKESTTIQKVTKPHETLGHGSKIIQQMIENVQKLSNATVLNLTPLQESYLFLGSLSLLLLLAIHMLCCLRTCVCCTQSQRRSTINNLFSNRPLMQAQPICPCCCSSPLPTGGSGGLFQMILSCIHAFLAESLELTFTGFLYYFVTRYLAWPQTSGLFLCAIFWVFYFFGLLLSGIYSWLNCSGNQSSRCLNVTVVIRLIMSFIGLLCFSAAILYWESSRVTNSFTEEDFSRSLVWIGTALLGTGITVHKVLWETERIAMVSLSSETVDPTEVAAYLGHMICPAILIYCFHIDLSLRIYPIFCLSLAAVVTVLAVIRLWCVGYTVIVDTTANHALAKFSSTTTTNDCDIETDPSAVHLLTTHHNNHNNQIKLHRNKRKKLAGGSVGGKLMMNHNDLTTTAAANEEELHHISLSDASDEL